MAQHGLEAGTAYCQLASARAAASEQQPVVTGSYMMAAAVEPMDTSVQAMYDVHAFHELRMCQVYLYAKEMMSPLAVGCAVEAHAVMLQVLEMHLQHLQPWGMLLVAQDCSCQQAPVVCQVLDHSDA